MAQGSAPAGPSPTAEWDRESVSARRPLALLVLPDDAARSRVRYYLPARPHLRRDESGTPALSLTLVLSRRPGPLDENISDLVQQGVLTFDLTLAVPAEALRRFTGRRKVRLQPLFARRAVFTLSRGQSELARVSATGINATAALSVTLGATDALRVLAALDGKPSPLGLSVDIALRTAARRRMLRLTAEGARLLQVLSSLIRPQSSIRSADLRAWFSASYPSGAVQATLVDGAESPEEVPADFPGLYEAFLRLASPFLRRETPDLDPSDPANRYSCQPRAAASRRLTYEEQMVSAAEREVTLTAGLDEILGGALEGQDNDRFIHLVFPAPDGGVAPAPKLAAIERRPRSSRMNNEPRRFAVSPHRAESLMAALRPDPEPPAPTPALLASDMVTLSAASVRGRAWWLHNTSLEDSAPPQSRPVVDDPNAPFWPDRLESGKLWYAPTFETVPLSPTDPAETSSFLFTYESGYRQDGQVWLECDARFSFRPVMAAATRDSLGGREASMVEFVNLAAALELPFRDQTGSAKTEAVPTTVVRAGDTFTAQAKLSNDWVGLAYGALAWPGFQRDPPRLLISYTYDTYTPIREHIELALAGVHAVTPIAVTGGPRQAGQPFFDVAHGTYRSRYGDVRFKREPSLASRSKRGTASGNGLARRSLGQIASVTRPAVVRPLLHAGVLPHFVRAGPYARRSIARQERVTVVYPCATYGALYRHRTSAGSVAIGCRDALRLGQTIYQQYDELTTLAHERYRVYRSLQQPGRFLVVPKRYLITRYAPGSPKAYRPVILVYSTIDADEPEKNRVVFDATLEPDLPPFLRRELRTKLSSIARDPVLEYPTEIKSAVALRWTLEAGIERSMRQAPDSFQVSLATDLTNAVLLRSRLEAGGVGAGVKFELPDGSELESQLVLKLDEITGPMAEGAVRLELANGNARLTNKIERAVGVEELAVYDSAGAALAPILLNVELAPGASHQVPVEPNVREAFVAYAIADGDVAKLEEIRSFVEDITTNAIFIDLVNYGNHGIKSLQVRTRLKGVKGTYTVGMSGEPPSGNVSFTLPLTTYLEKHIAQFRVTKAFTAKKKKEHTPWINWDLENKGNVIGIDWETIR